jgi:hypothetical protein
MGCPQLVKRLRWFALLIASLPLFGAAEIGLPAPVVVVYPLTATGDVGSPNTGSNIGTAIANKLVELGGLTVKPFVAGTTRPQYLTAALSQSADYYITGYLTPLGSEVSVVEQVVSTRSGTIVYSTTAFARTYADAVGPAADLREAILRHAGRGLASLDAPPPSPSPEPLANASGVNISKAFGRRHHAQPAAAASAQPVASAPAQPAVAASALPALTAPVPALTASLPAAPGASATSTTAASSVALAGPHDRALVVATSGAADPDARSYASQSLGGALRQKGFANALLTVTSADVSAHAADLCRANGAMRFYAPTLTVENSGKAPSVALDVVAYDCLGTVVGHEKATATFGKRGSMHGALDAAAAGVAGEFAAAAGRTTTRVTPPATS